MHQDACQRRATREISGARPLSRGPRHGSGRLGGNPHPHRVRPSLRSPARGERREHQRGHGSRGVQQPVSATGVRHRRRVGGYEVGIEHDLRLAQAFLGRAVGAICLFVNASKGLSAVQLSLGSAGPASNGAGSLGRTCQDKERNGVVGFVAVVEKRETPRSAWREDARRSLSRRRVRGYDGQAATRLAHIPTGAPAATGRSV